MARHIERSRALELRTKGWSYSQIKTELKLSKSTLSTWLRNYPLSPERIKELKLLGKAKLEKFIATRRKHREMALRLMVDEYKEKLFPLSEKELFLSGLCLYWGEGAKTNLGDVRLANTDPAVVQSFVYWLTKIFKIERLKIRVRLHLYKDMDVEKETQFWMDKLKFSRSAFKNPYIKKSLLSGLTYKNGFGHGTCNVILYDAKVGKQIHTAISALKEFFARA